MYHGTHVAGIVAGKLGSFVGVAPDATILSYKVFGRIDNTDEETIIEAFLMAYEDGADIITASLGAAYGFSDDPWAIVASRLVDKGVLITIAAGNDGKEGGFYAGSGSSGENVLAVASVETSELPALPFYATFNLDGVSNQTTVGTSISFIQPCLTSILYRCCLR
jgi:subtilisin family serine protease